MHDCRENGSTRRTDLCFIVMAGHQARPIGRPECKLVPATYVFKAHNNAIVDVRHMAGRDDAGMEREG
jgi:hypothetical protein